MARVPRQSGGAAPYPRRHGDVMQNGSVVVVEQIRAILKEHGRLAVDSEARFPHEAIDALKKARMMGALVPSELGGYGCGMIELAAMCEALAQHCASAAMVFAMHQIQVASILRHAIGQPYYGKYISE